MAMKTPESREKAAIKKYLDDIGAWHFSPFMKGYGKTGVPDIIACVRLRTGGWFVAIEVKREGKEPTKLQVYRMTEIIKAGGFALAGTADVVIPQIERLRA